VVDLASSDPAADLEVVRTELGAYDPALLSRPTIVVGTKADLAPDVDAQALLGGGAIAVSAVTTEGMEPLRERLSALARDAEAVAEDRSAYVVLRPARPRFTVTREGGRFRVVGRGVERWVSETDLEDPAKVERLQRRLVKEGVERELVSAGARRGDEVLIGDVAFEFIPEGQADGTA
jgi:GTP-binding protein